MISSSDRIYSIVSLGALLLACRVWYDVMNYLHTRERLRICDLLMNRGIELLQVAMTDPSTLKRIKK